MSKRPWAVRFVLTQGLFFCDTLHSLGTKVAPSSGGLTKKIYKMKKFLLSFAVVATIIGVVFACSTQSQWSRKEREDMRKLLRDYRKMVDLQKLEEEGGAANG